MDFVPFHPENFPLFCPVNLLCGIHSNGKSARGMQNESERLFFLIQPLQPTKERKEPNAGVLKNDS